MNEFEKVIAERPHIAGPRELNEYLSKLEKAIAKETQRRADQISQDYEQINRDLAELKKQARKQKGDFWFSGFIWGLVASLLLQAIIYFI